MRQIDANAEPEECVALCLTEIADQAFEVARSIVRWLASEGCPDTTGESAISLRQVSAERWMPCTAMPSLITSNGNMGALGFAQSRFVGESRTT